MEHTLLLGIAIDDTVSLAVADADGQVIVQTAYPNDAAAGPDLFLAQLIEEAQVLLYPLPGQLRRIGVVSAAAQPMPSGWLADRLGKALQATVVSETDAVPPAECPLERAIELARRALA